MFVTLFSRTPYLINETSVRMSFTEVMRSRIYFGKQLYEVQTVSRAVLTSNATRGTGPVSSTDLLSARLEIPSRKRVSTTENGNDSRWQHKIIINTIPTFRTELHNIIFHPQKINLSFLNAAKLLVFCANVCQARWFLKWLSFCCKE